MFFAPTAALDDNFQDIVSLPKQLQHTEAFYGSVFNVSAWSVTSDSFILIPGNVYVIPVTGKVQLFKTGPQITTKFHLIVPKSD